MSTNIINQFKQNLYKHNKRAHELFIRYGKDVKYASGSDELDAYNRALSKTIQEWKGPIEDLSKLPSPFTWGIRNFEESYLRAQKALREKVRANRNEVQAMVNAAKTFKTYLADIAREREARVYSQDKRVIIVRRAGESAWTLWAGMVEPSEHPYYILPGQLPGRNVTVEYVEHMYNGQYRLSVKVVFKDKGLTYLTEHDKGAWSPWRRIENNNPPYGWNLPLCGVAVRQGDLYFTSSTGVSMPRLLQYGESFTLPEAKEEGIKLISQAKVETGDETLYFQRVSPYYEVPWEIKEVHLSHRDHSTVTVERPVRKDKIKRKKWYIIATRFQGETDWNPGNDMD